MSIAVAGTTIMRLGSGHATRSTVGAIGIAARIGSMAIFRIVAMIVLGIAGISVCHPPQWNRPRRHPGATLDAVAGGRVLVIGIGAAACVLAIGIAASDRRVTYGHRDLNRVLRAIRIRHDNRRPVLPGFAASTGAPCNLNIRRQFPKLAIPS